MSEIWAHVTTSRRKGQPREGIHGPTTRFRWVKSPMSVGQSQFTICTLAHRIGCLPERRGLLERDTENRYLTWDAMVAARASHCSSPASRNARRIGLVANEATKNGGVALCAPIAPYTATRRAVRECIAGHGAFIEIHVATPLEVCEARDRKGLYEKARKGLIPEFTGISDPYEVPEHPEIRLDTTDLSPVEAAQEIFLFLLREVPGWGHLR